MNTSRRPAALRAAEAEVAAVDRRRREDVAAANRARADARTNAAAAQQRVRDAQARLRAVRRGQGERSRRRPPRWRGPTPCSRRAPCRPTAVTKHRVFPPRDPRSCRSWSRRRPRLSACSVTSTNAFRDRASAAAAAAANPPRTRSRLPRIPGGVRERRGQGEAGGGGQGGGRAGHGAARGLGFRNEGDPELPL